MDEYEDLVSEAFRLHSTLPFSNGSAVDARIVIKHIFLNADKEVCLYSDSLYDWDELYDAAEVFLQKTINASLKIKVSREMDDYDGRSQFLNLELCYPRRVHLTWGIGERGPNFTINDRGGFRLERGNGHQAVACANDMDFSSALKTVFDKKLIARPNSAEASA